MLTCSPEYLETYRAELARGAVGAEAAEALSQRRAARRKKLRGFLSSITEIGHGHIGGPRGLRGLHHH